MQVELNKLYPEILAIIGLLSDSFGTQISAFVAGNPKAAMACAVAAFILNKFAAPPTVTPASPVAPKV